MLSTPFNKPLVLITKATLQKALLIIIPHVLVMLVMLFVPYYSLVLRLFIILLISFSLAYFIRLHLFASLRKSVISIKQDSAKNWFVLTHHHENSEYREMILLSSSFISHYLIIQNFSDLSHKKWLKPRYTAIFTPDSLSVAEFRRLKVRLKVDKSH